MNVLLTGATGFLGRHIADILVEGGHYVRPVSRSHGINFCTMLAPEAWLPLLDGVDAVINCVGIIGENRTQRFETIHTLAPIALFKACKLEGIRRVIQISAIGTDNNAFTSYHLSKLAADNMLRNLDLDSFILRPSLIYGKGGTSTAMLMRLARFPLIPAVGDGNQLLQPIHVGDVAAIVKNALTEKNTRQTLDIVGSEIISYTSWLQTLRQAQGLRPAQVIHIPTLIAAAVMRVGSYFSPVLHPDNLRMLQASYIAGVGQTVEILGRLPKRVEAGLFFSDISANGEIV